MTPGDLYIREDGAAVRIDRVANGQVYFMAWAPGATCGAPKRMTVRLFREALDVEVMRRELPEVRR